MDKYIVLNTDGFDGNEMGAEVELDADTANEWIERGATLQASAQVETLPSGGLTFSSVDDALKG